MPYDRCSKGRRWRGWQFFRRFLDICPSTWCQKRKNISQYSWMIKYNIWVWIHIVWCPTVAYVTEIGVSEYTIDYHLTRACCVWNHPILNLWVSGAPLRAANATKVKLLLVNICIRVSMCFECCFFSVTILLMGWYLHYIYGYEGLKPESMQLGKCCVFQIMLKYKQVLNTKNTYLCTKYGGVVTLLAANVRTATP
jgi:hypothetical protein